MPQRVTGKIGCALMVAFRFCLHALFTHIASSITHVTTLN